MVAQKGALLDRKMDKKTVEKRVGE